MKSRERDSPKSPRRHENTKASGRLAGGCHYKTQNKNRIPEYRILKISFSNSDQPGNRSGAFAFLLVVALGSCVTIELRAQDVVMPNTLATNDGNTSFTAQAGPLPGEGLRSMEIFDASQCAVLSGPSFLTQFAWRPDPIPGPSGPRTSTLRIYASTTSRSVAQMSPTFADNLGANNTLVFDGTVTVVTQNLPGPGNTRQFDIVYPFTTPLNGLVEYLDTNSSAGTTFYRTTTP
jgi:hypothetical protein